MVDHILGLIEKSVKSRTFLDQVSKRLGVSSSLVEKGIGIALPFILGGLAKNAADEKGAESLVKALDKKHDGSILDHFDGLIEDPDKGEGKGILKHIMGSAKEKAMEHFISSKTGLDKTQSKSIARILSPMVMGAIGKEKKEGKLDIKNLSSEMSQAASIFEDQSPVDNGLVGMFLDQDGDGDIKDDLLGMGMGFLKNR